MGSSEITWLQKINTVGTRLDNVYIKGMGPDEVT